MFDFFRKGKGRAVERADVAARLALVRQGTLPTVANTIDLPLGDGETLHYIAGTALRKQKTVTKRIGYGGLTGSVRVVKGVRLRIGSLDVKRETQKVVETDDFGLFYITNERIVFQGKGHRFVVPLTKVVGLEVNGDGLYLYKDGKEVPYIFALLQTGGSLLPISADTADEYELPSAVYSLLRRP